MNDFDAPGLPQIKVRVPGIKARVRLSISGHGDLITVRFPATVSAIRLSRPQQAAAGRVLTSF